MSVIVQKGLALQSDWTLAAKSTAKLVLYKWRKALAAKSVVSRKAWTPLPFVCGDQAGGVLDSVSLS